MKKLSNDKTSWTEREAQDEIINFDNTKLLVLEFLDNGKDEYDKEITKKDGTKGIIKHSVIFKVLFNQKEFTFNISGVKLMNLLSVASNKKPKGKVFRIKKELGRTEVENTYTVELIK